MKPVSRLMPGRKYFSTQAAMPVTPLSAQSPVVPPRIHLNHFSHPKNQPAAPPSALKRQKLKRLLWAGGLVLAAGMVLWVNALPVSVRAVHPARQMVVETLAASGQVHGDVESSIGADYSGRVAMLLVREGDRVQLGQALAYLDMRVLRAQEKQVRINLAVAKAQLVQVSRPPLPSEIERVRAETTEAVVVAKAKLEQARQRLAELRRGPTLEAKRVARAQLEQAKAQMAQAHLDLTRQQSLFKGGRIPRSALEQAKTALQVAYQAKAQTDEQLNQARRDVERERQLYRTNSRVELDEAETNYHTAQETVAQSEADLLLAQQEVARQQRLFEGGASPRAELDRAQATVKVANNSSEMAKAKLAKAALDLKRQQLLFEDGKAPKAAWERAETALQFASRSAEQARAKLAQAQRDLDQQQQLFATNNRAELDHATTSYRVAQGAVTAASAQWRDLQLGTRAESLAQAEADVEVARGTLKGALESGGAQMRNLFDHPRPEDVQLARAQVQEAQQELQVAHERLRDAVVRAPFAGTVAAILIEAGGITSPAQPILKLVRSGRPEIRLDVDENNLGRLKIGQRAIVSSSAFAQERFEARLQEIGAEVDAQSGTVEVRLTPVSPPAWLRPGQTLNVNIIVDEGTPHLTLPVTAVTSRGPQSSVLLVRQGVAARRWVRSGPASQKGVPILSGLTSSDVVIVAPRNVAEGQRVRATIQMK